MGRRVMIHTDITSPTSNDATTNRRDFEAFYDKATSYGCVTTYIFTSTSYTESGYDKTQEGLEPDDERSKYFGNSKGG